ncbi:MAG: acyl transferase [Chitinophagaceae bacterium]|nr:acyl transferase [Chitinophagaceae bacterium]
MEVFRFQYEHNSTYRQFVSLTNPHPETINNINAIPFLPIQLFKTQQVKTTDFDAKLIFESSGTTQTTPSRHYIKEPDIYTKSFCKGFAQFYGDPSAYCIIGLLPSYLERQHSSLVVMVDELIRLSGHPKSGFYLYEQQKLADTLISLENNKQKTLLIGVTFALLDFAEQCPLPLQYTSIMETGGMKGRRTEITRQEVHNELKQAFNVPHIHSEYGMTELLSQAYSKGDGIFYTPPWMKILIRDEEDPLHIFTSPSNKTRGAINVIDLANIYSCSFIATEDAGTLYNDGSFEILGRIDNSDMRGCSLLAI